MDIEEFLSASIQQIVGGIVKSQVAVSGTGAIVNPAESFSPPNDAPVGAVINVEFDVGVSIAESSQLGGHAGANFGVIKVGGSDGSGSTSSSSSRVAFVIPIVLPVDAASAQAALQKLREGRKPLTIRRG